MSKISITTNDTLEVTYRVSSDTGELSEILNITKNSTTKDISNLNVKEIKKFTWNPQSSDENKTYKFNINGETLEVKVLPNLVDDFEDGSIDDWEIIEGSWTATNNYLEDQSGTEYKEIEYSSISFDASKNFNAEWDIRFNSGDKYQSTTFRPIYKDENNKVEVIMHEEGRFDCSIFEGGNRIARINPGWSHNLNFHTIRIEHRDNTWELFFDGNSQGTDTGSVSYSGLLNIRNRSWHNGTNDTYDFDNITISQL
jgi:hypothetical protein